MAQKYFIKHCSTLTLSGMAIGLGVANITIKKTEEQNEKIRIMEENLISNLCDETTNSNKYSDWMGNLPEKVRSRPVSQLTIPGSHDSFTYSLVKSGKAGPDQPAIIRAWAAAFPSLAYHILYRWSICQHKVATYQLQNGVRYFDIRLVALDEKENTEKLECQSNPHRVYRVLHCLYGIEIEAVLSEIEVFLSNHPKEVVIIDLQHMYNFKTSDHDNMIRKIKEIFQTKLCPWQQDLDQITLDYMHEAGHQVIVIYPSLFCREVTNCSDLPIHNFWPRSLCPTPWPNTTSTRNLVAFLDKGLDERDQSLMYVSQGVLTPSLLTVLAHPFSDLQTALGYRCNKEMLKWLKKAHINKPNIVITDFLFDNSSSCDIVDAIVQMNFRD